MHRALSSDSNRVYRVPDVHLSLYHSVQLSLFLLLRGLTGFLRSTLHVRRSQSSVPSSLGWKAVPRARTRLRRLQTARNLTAPSLILLPHFCPAELRSRLERMLTHYVGYAGMPHKTPLAAGPAALWQRAAPSTRAGISLPRSAGNPLHLHSQTAP